MKNKMNAFLNNFSNFTPPKILVIFIVVMFLLGYIFIDGIREVVNLVIISFIVAYTLKPIRDYISENHLLFIQNYLLLFSNG